MICPAFGLALVCALVPPLRPGDRAPDLSRARWIQGEPVRELDQGRVTVLGFFATWSPESLEAISDHHRLARLHAGRDLDVIGVAVWTREDDLRPEELAAGIDEFDYRACRDDEIHSIGRAYLATPVDTRLPISFVIDRDGRVAWAGNPKGGLFAAVERVLSGTFDPAAFARREAELQGQADVLFEDLQGEILSENWRRVADIAGELDALDPRFCQMALLRYTALLHARQRKRAARHGASLLERFFDDPYWLNELAWTIVDPRGEVADAERDLPLAERAARRAVELSGRRRDYVLDTLARCLFLSGDLDGAIALQEEAVAVSRLRTDEYRGVLAEYKAAKNRRDSGRR